VIDARGRHSDVSVAVHTAAGVQQWLASSTALPFDDSPGAPWLLVPSPVRAAFDALIRSGVPLAESHFGPPLLGVKCGCNAAFVVVRDMTGPNATADDDHLVAVRASPASGDPRSAAARSGRVESALLRPVVRGETLGRWAIGAPAWDTRPAGAARGRRTAHGPEWIIWTHDDPSSGHGGPLGTLPPGAAQWLVHWRHRLAARSDTRGRTPWWSLFRTESASAAYARVVWADLGRVPRAALLPRGDPTVPLNSCYVARAPDVTDAQALTALLNSAPAAAWLNIIAEPARGGYRRYLGWTVGLLPLPHNWIRAREHLAPIAEAAAANGPPSEAVLTRAVSAAYGLDGEILRPLLAWIGT
jgi:hypothetical protein